MRIYQQYHLQIENFFFFPLLDVMKSSGFLSCQPPSWFSSLEVNFSSGIQSMQSCWDTQQETWLIIQPFTYWIMFCKRLDIYFIIGHRKKKILFGFNDVIYKVNGLFSFLLTLFIKGVFSSGWTYRTKGPLWQTWHIENHELIQGEKEKGFKI